jgi:hypothetical protein
MEMGNPHFLTGIKKNESPFPYRDPHIKMGLGTSSNGERGIPVLWLEKFGEEI